MCGEETELGENVWVIFKFILYYSFQRNVTYFFFQNKQQKKLMEGFFRNVK